MASWKALLIFVFLFGLAQLVPPSSGRSLPSKDDVSVASGQNNRHQGTGMNKRSADFYFPSPVAAKVSSDAAEREARWFWKAIKIGTGIFKGIRNIIRNRRRG